MAGLFALSITRCRISREVSGLSAEPAREFRRGMANWAPATAGRGFELLFRLYGVRKSFFDGKWVLPDAGKVV
jgi:hypothetical protein